MPATGPGATQRHPLRYASYDALVDAADDIERITGNNVRGYCSSVGKLKLKGDEHLADGDNEMAFIYLWRVVSITMALQKNPEYVKNKPKYKQEIAKCNKAAGETLNQLDGLKAKLKACYDAAVAPKKQAVAPASSTAASTAGQKAGADPFDLDLPNVPMDMAPTPGAAPSLDEYAKSRSESLSVLEKMHSSASSPEVTIISETAASLAVSDGVLTPVRAGGVPSDPDPLAAAGWKSLACEDLKSLITGSSGSDLLLLDVRSREDYASSHVQPIPFSVPCCNIPPVLLRPGVSCADLEQRLVRKAKRWFANRQAYRTVVIIAGEEGELLDPRGSAQVLKDALWKYEGVKQLQSEPVAVAGGYPRWYLLYPALCSGQLARRRGAAPVVPGSIKRLKREYPKLPSSKPSPAEDAAPPSADEMPGGPRPGQMSVDRAPVQSPRSSQGHQPPSRPPPSLQQRPGAQQWTRRTQPQPAPSSPIQQKSQQPGSAPLRQPENRQVTFTADHSGPTSPVVEPSPPSAASTLYAGTLPGPAPTGAQASVAGQSAEAEETAQHPRPLVEPRNPEPVGAQSSMDASTHVAAPKQTELPAPSPTSAEPTIPQDTSPTAEAATRVTPAAPSAAAPRVSPGAVPETPLIPTRDLKPKATVPAFDPPSYPANHHPLVVPAVAASAPTSRATEGFVTPTVPSARKPYAANTAATTPAVSPPADVPGAGQQPQVPSGFPKPAAAPRNASPNEAAPPSVASGTGNPSDGTTAPTRPAPTPYNSGQNGGLARPPVSTAAAPATGPSRPAPPATQQAWSPSIDLLNNVPKNIGSQDRTNNRAPAAVPDRRSKPQPGVLQPRRHSQQASENPGAERRSSQRGPSHERRSSLQGQHAGQYVGQRHTLPPSVNRAAKPSQALVGRSSPAVRKARYESMDLISGSLGRALTGLRNLGNTCFLNSVLQCLMHTVPLSTYFVQGRYRNDVNRTSVLGAQGAIAEEYGELALVMWCARYRSLAPRFLLDILAKSNPMFAGREQQDSQELAATLLDGLHEDLNRVQKKVYIEEPDTDGVPLAIAGDTAWANHKRRNDSVIVDMFQGQYKSAIRCRACGYESVTFEPFMFLSLPITNNRHTSLEACLRKFAKVETLSKNDQWRCKRCDCFREATKSLRIWRLPPILLIHLKRFSFDGPFRNKLQTEVRFPLKGLNLQECTEGKLRGPYNLYAVSNHYGTMTGGHYTAFCKHEYTDRWFTFDDSVVKPMAASSVCSSAGYLLFYTSVNFGHALPSFD